MHWHIWRKRRREEYLIAQGLLPMPVEMLPMGKHILQQEQLEKLFPVKEISEQPNDDAPGCVVCLESMAVGSKVRKLPCEHEYHCSCIGECFFFKKSFFLKYSYALCRSMAHCKMC